MKDYQKPSIEAMDTLSFETICASADEGTACTFAGRTNVVNDGSVNGNSCLKCFNTNWKYGAPNGYIPIDNIGSGWNEEHISNYLSQGGTCPEGKTL